MALEWATETLRLSLFCPEDVKITSADWKSVTGQDEPQTLQNVAGRRSLIGPFQGGILNISTVGSRLDCVLQPKAPTESIEEGYVPTVGPWADACREFVKATSALLPTVGAPVSRLAFACNLMAKCANLQDAYNQLLGMLRSVKGDPQRMRELLFRVNWPVTGAASGGLINRISTWAVLQIQLQLVVQTGAKTAVSDIPATHVVRLEIDNSTDAENLTPFDRERLVPIYEELVALAAENAEKGEVL